MVLMIQGLIILLWGACLSVHACRCPGLQQSAQTNRERTNGPLPQFVLTIDATLRVATPLILCAMAGLFSERSGIIDISLKARC